MPSKFKSNCKIKKLTRKIQGGGATIKDVDNITDLLFKKILIYSYSNNSNAFRTAHKLWKPYFEQSTTKRADIQATPLMIEAITMLNSRGQSILYCAYRYLHNLPNHNHWLSSFQKLIEIPGIDLNIRNANGDLPICGIVWEGNDIKNILTELVKYMDLSKNNLLNEDGIIIYKMIIDRISGEKGTAITQ